MSSKSRTRRSLHETSRQRNVVTGTCFAICSGMFSAWSEIKKEYQNERNNFFVWKAEIKMVEETEPSFFSAFFHSLVRCGKFFRNPAALSGIAGEILGTTDEACEGWNKAWIIDVDRKQSEKKWKSYSAFTDAPTTVARVERVPRCTTRKRAGVFCPSTQERKRKKSSPLKVSFFAVDFMK